MNKKTIDAFIFDDEPGAIQTLMGMLAMFCPNIRITRTATSVNEGLMLLQEQSPDLLFLDIEMPPFGNGFAHQQRNDGAAKTHHRRKHQQHAQIQAIGV